jgi:hypothetical protein
VLEGQIDDLLKTWRGIIFDHPHLRAYDEDPNTGKVDTTYTNAVGKRFGQWVIDTAKAQYDQAWLDYQYETRAVWGHGRATNLALARSATSPWGGPCSSFAQRPRQHRP